MTERLKAHSGSAPDWTVIPCPARFVDRESGATLMEVVGETGGGVCLRLRGPDGQVRVYLRAVDVGTSLEMRHGDRLAVYLGDRGPDGGYLEVCGPAGAVELATEVPDGACVKIGLPGGDTLTSLPARVAEESMRREREYTTADYRTIEAKVKELEAQLAARS